MKKRGGAKRRSSQYLTEIKLKTPRGCLFGLLLFLSGNDVFSQIGGFESIPNQFEKYSSGQLQEKLFVHTDKDLYLAGEMIWFKLYEADGFLNKLLELDKLAYVELVSKDHQAVLQAKIELKKGMGNGSFMLPASLSSGNYLFRAYTNWMKNFSADLYFEKPVTIINALRNSSGNEAGDSSVFDIRLFPEGGNLVADIQSRIGFRIADRNGNGIEAKGVIIARDKDTVARFSTLKFGLGSFYFTPYKGESYKAFVQLANGNWLPVPIPGIFDDGYVLTVLEDEKNMLKVDVAAGHASGNSLVYLLINTRNSVRTARLLSVVNGHASCIVSKDSLGEGISQLTLFNSFRKPVCERLYFKPPKNKLDITISPDLHKAYGERKKVTLDIDTRDRAGRPVAANMSIAVYLTDVLQHETSSDIRNYFWLGAELGGNIASPEYYFQEGLAVDEATENLMLTHGWRRFRWDDVLSDKKPAFEFLPELEGHIIRGSLLDKRSGHPGIHIGMWLSAPGKKYQLARAVTDGNGMFRFVVNELYGRNELVLQNNSPEDSIYRAELADPFSEKFSTTTLPLLELQEKWKDQLIKHSIGSQVRNTFLREKNLIYIPPLIADTTMFYGTPDKRYLLDDYARFPTMEEVIREYVTEVRLRKQNDQFHFQVNNIPFQYFFNTDPLVLLDGVPVSDMNKIIAMDPLKIRKMEIVARKYYLGSLANEGIVSFATYGGDLGGYNLDPSSLLIDYQGMQARREFYSPVYETGDQLMSRVPDFRTLLYWSPELATGASGKQSISFYTSDLPGRYVVVIQGISPEGYAGSGSAGFSVEK